MEMTERQMVVGFGGCVPGSKSASYCFLLFKERRRWYRYSAYAWLSAAAVTTVGVAMDLAEVGGAYRPLYGRRLCWFNNRGGLLVLFAVPVGVLLTANVVMFALSVLHIRRASNASQLAVQKTDHTQLMVSQLSVSLTAYSI